MISVIIPAYNEALTLPGTLSSLQKNRFWDELLVVDDGSTDRTGETPLPVGGKWIAHPRNLGKGRAIRSGLREASGDILLLLDADLGESACYAEDLLRPVQEGLADAAIAKWPAAGRGGGFGLVKRFAKLGIFFFTRMEDPEPLSGQRCYRRTILPYLSFCGEGYGIEVSMDLDLLRTEARIMWISLPFVHREKGRGVEGIFHRMRQGVEIGLTFYRELMKEVKKKGKE